MAMALNTTVHMTFPSFFSAIENHVNKTAWSSSSVNVYSTIAALIGFTLVGYFLSQDRSKHRVPGPSGLPIFGSIFELRNGHAKMLEKWKNCYGDIFRIWVGNQPVLVLNSRAAVSKTLVKQGAAFQSRPEWNIWHGTFVHSADTGGVLTLGTSKWSDDISRLRKAVSPVTSPRALSTYNEYPTKRYNRLMETLSNLGSKPRDLGYFWWSTTIGLGTDQLVGHVHDDETVKLICNTEINIFRLRSLGYPLHDWIPILNLYRTLVGGFEFCLRRIVDSLGFKFPRLFSSEAEDRASMLRQNQAKYCKSQLSGLVERLEQGDERPSQLGDLFRSLPERLSAYEEYLLMTTLSGSGMATGTILTWLTGYLASHPEIQAKAHQEIHDVYKGESPDPHDTNRVEYIKALALEAGRFWTPVRLGFFRETQQDARIDDYHIPKGTMVVYNSFQINRDPTGYDFPDSFIPERWINGHHGRTDTVGSVGDSIGVPHMGHGAGRRLCLGISNVNKSLYGILVLVLHYFKFERAELDDEGMREVFPSFRACGQSSHDMDPVKDQVFSCDAQAVPRATGVRVIPREPEKLAQWMKV
ncbi:hypothetical protein NM208_g13350 [Fusarium decemcellulare]|uniref:Uncharacterized protein n=1 Tax=Fusarium decemcellulare TaxID=57161 RepID=A0ACC1RNQ1_9HYPO|nr:hypothetical protein NM208_g13350 [Fusarium decemcellulare]